MGTQSNLRRPERFRPAFAAVEEGDKTEFADPIVRKIGENNKRLPIIRALQDEEEALDELHNLLERLEGLLAPIVNTAPMPSKIDGAQDSTEPHDDACGISEGNASRIRYAGDRVEELMSRLSF